MRPAIVVTENGPRVNPCAVQKYRVSSKQAPAVFQKFVGRQLGSRKNRIREFDGDLGAVQEDTISIINGVNALYANMFSEPLRIRLVGQMNFDQGNPFGPTGSDLDAVIDSSELLLDFQDWRATMIILSGLPDHDAAHAFLGQRFNFGGISGVSNQGQICRDLFFPPFMALAID
eukprot:435041_1